MKLRKLLLATVLGIGLLGSQVGTAEASTQATEQNTQAKYQYVTFKDWNSFKDWLDQCFKGYYKKDQTEAKPNVPEKNEEEAQKPKPEQKPESEPDKNPAPEQQQPQPPVEQQPAPTPTPEQQDQPKEEEQVNGLSAEEQQMLNLVNQERKSQGLQPLKANLELTKVARVKAKDMITNNYFSHQSPVYGSPFDMMKQFGISYRTAGENLAGNQTVQKAHTALMNSEGHRANILKPAFTEVGIGIVSGGPYGKMFVQMFKG